MARAVRSDYLHNMRFTVDVVGVNGNAWLQVPGQAQAGFMNINVPDMTVDSQEYKEGQWIYSRKFPGNPAPGGDLTMQRGVARMDSSFWHWLRCVIEGSGEYRADLNIKHFHREQALTRPLDEGGDKPNLTVINTDKPARTYHVFEAFPVSHKVSGDLDATASDISLMEITAAFEYFEVEEHAAT